MIQNNYKTSKYIIKKIDKETIEEANAYDPMEKFLPYFTCKTFSRFKRNRTSG